MVDRDAVLAHVLAKHHLLADERTDDVVQVADDLGGLHATSATSPYLSLHARVRGFALEDLDRELYERGTLIRLKGMRGTVFVLSRRLAPIVFAATADVTLARDRRWLGLDERAYRDAAAVVLDGRAAVGMPRLVRRLARRVRTLEQLRSWIVTRDRSETLPDPPGRHPVPKQRLPPAPPNGAASTDSLATTTSSAENGQISRAWRG